MNKYFKYLFASIALLVSTLSTFAAPQNGENPVNHDEENSFNISDVIFGHINDAYEWHVFSLGNFDATVHLPVILYSPVKGLSVFCSSKFGAHGHYQSYNGYSLVNGNSIVADDGSRVYDFSLTKNVVAMLVGVVIMLFLFLGVAKKYKKGGSSKAPSGFQNAIEVCIEFIRDEVARPALGDKYPKYMPLLLTIFFFIWVMNMLGMIPGGANVTGNIAVTACLAIIAFIVMLFSSKSHFWGHLFNPPGMPFFVKVILVPIELISLIIKPTALMIRLFANILAGHIVMICFMLLIFIFARLNIFVGSGFSIVSVGLATFSFLIELLVAAIQAYIFAFLTAIFVSQMIEEPVHADEGTYDYAEAKKQLEAEI